MLPVSFPLGRHWLITKAILFTGGEILSNEEAAKAVPEPVNMDHSLEPGIRYTVQGIHSKQAEPKYSLNVWSSFSNSLVKSR